jgi:hypothetical protein
MTEKSSNKDKKKPMPIGCGLSVVILNVILFAVDTMTGFIFFGIFGFWFLVFVIVKIFNPDY